MRPLLVLAWVGLLGCLPPDEPVQVIDDPVIVDTADTGAQPPPIDCDTLPPVPATAQHLGDFALGAGFDFDDAGRAVWLDLHLVGATTDGRPTVLKDHVGLSYLAGPRRLPNGDWALALRETLPSDVSVWKLDAATGQTQLLLDGLDVASTMEVDGSGRVYVADATHDQVWDVDAATGQSTLITSSIANPVDVVPTPDGAAVYVLSRDLLDATVHRIDRLGPAAWDTPQVFWNGPLETYENREMLLDACGNLYLFEDHYNQAGDVLWRISADGAQIDEVYRFAPELGFTFGIRWGNGVGGWEADVIHVYRHDARDVWGIDLGIPGSTTRWE